uniref:Uncharacterized protein n=1 Tax=Leersia perrieri TaxID=77586 RepID=A0A0D9XIA1_9ORYZ
MFGVKEARSEAYDKREGDITASIRETTINYKPTSTSLPPTSSTHMLAKCSLICSNFDTEDVHVVAAEDIGDNTSMVSTETKIGEDGTGIPYIDNPDHPWWHMPSVRRSALTPMVALTKPWPPFLTMDDVPISMRYTHIGTRGDYDKGAARFGVHDEQGHGEELDANSVKLVEHRVLGLIHDGLEEFVTNGHNHVDAGADACVVAAIFEALGNKSKGEVL